MSAAGTQPANGPRYLARRARGADDLEAACAIRAAAFGLGAPDRDPFDDACIQIVIEDRRASCLVGCFRKKKEEKKEKKTKKKKDK